MTNVNNERDAIGTHWNANCQFEDLLAELQVNIVDKKTLFNDINIRISRLLSTEHHRERRKKKKKKKKKGK